MHGVHHAAELDDRAVSGALDDVAVMGGDSGIDEVAAEAPKTHERALLIGAGEPAINVSAWAFLKLGFLVMPPALLLAIAGLFVL